MQRSLFFEAEESGSKACLRRQAAALQNERISRLRELALHDMANGPPRFAAKSITSASSLGQSHKSG
jgi:hypothetical protein